MRGSAVVAVAIAVLCFSGAAAGRGGTFVSQPPIGQAIEGTPLVLHGHLRGAPRAATVLLQGKQLEAGWHTLARASVHGSSFAVTWHPRADPGSWMIRFALVGRHGSLITTGRVRQVLVGRAPVLCGEPTTPVLSPGDGAIVGGVYIDGGPAPGVHECQAAATVVNVLDSGGAVVASQTVADDQSYAFQLPPGSYELRSAGSFGCTGQAVVKAGQVTHADTECPVP